MDQVSEIVRRRVAMFRDDCKVKPTSALEIAAFRSDASFEQVQLLTDPTFSSEDVSVTQRMLELGTMA